MLYVSLVCVFEQAFGLLLVSVDAESGWFRQLNFRVHMKLWPGDLFMCCPAHAAVTGFQVAEEQPWLFMGRGNRLCEPT